ncbi:protein transport protein sft2-like isoform X1 [Asparagus officinalis]|uniref:protein transport protein sft2-like isoform X1 n=1 Tax=Asparagus officinalis TaxID=4686 RepID=UPI00098E63D7|nr:protein transport protein sft2-like isoform X1 [Asparagus officinalis]
MQKAAQGWFSGGPSSSTSVDDAGGGFDIEAAVKSANDKVAGTFSVVSKGMKELPGSFKTATSTVPSGKSLMYFGLLLASGIFFIFIAFTVFLPAMVLVPQKFAICFTLGCAMIVGSFFALKGPRNQLAHMLSKERIPFTLVFLGSMVGTVYVSMVLHSYILSVVFSGLQHQRRNPNIFLFSASSRTFYRQHLAQEGEVSLCNMCFLPYI